MGRTPPGETRARVLAFMTERLLAGRPPTVREVQEAFRFKAVQTAREHLEALVADGKLDKVAGRARGYRLPGARDDVVRAVPIVGRVQAGALTFAYEELEGHVHVASTYSAEDVFGLRVRGASMRGAGILDGDVVIVRKQRTARSGEIVVALVGEEATVKRLVRRGKRVELHPEADGFDPIPVGDDAIVIGKVVGLHRSY